MHFYDRLFFFFTQRIHGWFKAQNSSIAVIWYRDKFYLSRFKTIPQGMFQRMAHSDNWKKTALLIVGNFYGSQARCTASAQPSDRFEVMSTSETTACFLCKVLRTALARASFYVAENKLIWSKQKQSEIENIALSDEDLALPLTKMWLGWLQLTVFSMTLQVSASFHLLLFLLCLILIFTFFPFLNIPSIYFPTDILLLLPLLFPLLSFLLYSF